MSVCSNEPVHRPDAMHSSPVPQVPHIEDNNDDAAAAGDGDGDDDGDDGDDDDDDDTNAK